MIFSELWLVSYLRRLFMNEDILWDKFAETGSIEDYLRYSACREDKHDYC